MPAVRMKAINEAYAVLSDRSKRRQYDEMKARFGSHAHSRFRNSYSEKDIFSGSDIHRIFEELSRSLGVRGVDEIFKEFYGSNYRTFKFSDRGVFLFGGFSKGGGPFRMFKSFTEKLTGDHPPEKGEDLRDTISLDSGLAESGGPYAYFHRKKSKKLVVKIPPGVKDGQKIRLAGMGAAGKWGGEQGDLYLKIRIRKSLFQRVKELISGPPKG